MQAPTHAGPLASLPHLQPHKHRLVQPAARLVGQEGVEAGHQARLHSRAHEVKGRGRGQGAAKAAQPEAFSGQTGRFGHGRGVLVEVRLSLSPSPRDARLPRSRHVRAEVEVGWVGLG